MSEAKTQEKWDERQLKYAQFLARDKTTISGESRTDLQFAEAMGVNPSTLWRWKMQDGFMQLVFDLIMKDMVSDLPKMTRAIRAKATGQAVTYKDRRGKERELKPDTQAFMALMRQAKLLQADKQDVTSDGKALPTPVLPIAELRKND